MLKVVIRQSLAGRLFGCVASVLLVVTMAGCSGDAEEKQRFKKPTAKESAEGASAAAENQTGYIMDRYHAPEERLRRRQARLSTVLSQDVPAQQAASQN
jgi:uncharacterized lipoprotein